MKNDVSVDWGEPVAQGIGIFCVAACLLAFFPGWEFVGKIFAEKDAPAWVQAVGSIAAILVAVGVASWQSKEAEAKEARAEAQKKASEKEIAAYLLNTFCGALFAFVAKFKSEHAISAWDARTMGVLLKAEMSNVKDLPVLALSLESRKALFCFRLIAIQFIEIIEFAERSVFMNANGESFVSDSATIQLQKLIADLEPKLIEQHRVLKSDTL